MMASMRGALFALAFPCAAFAQDVTFDAGSADEDLETSLRSASLVLAIDADDDSSAQDYVAAARADYRRLLTALYANGYYAGNVSIILNGKEAATIAPLAAPAQVRSIAFRIDAGPRFTFGDATVGPLPSGTLLPESFARGEVAKSGAIRDAVRSGVTAWKQAGHAKAKPAGQQIAAQHDTRKLDVAVTIAQGPQLTFGALSVTGNTDVRAARIKQIAGLPVGAVYDPAEIIKAERRLRETGAFDSVAAVEADTIAKGDTLPVTLQVVESKPRRFGFGIELSTIEGLKVSTFWLHRNFLGGAERFRVDGEVSGIGGETGGIDYTLGLNFERPAIYGADTDLFVRAQISRLDEPEFIVDKASVEAGVSRKITDDLMVQTGIGLLTAREQTDAGTRSYTLLTAPLSATYDRRNDPTNATDGYYIDADITPFYDVTNESVGARVFVDARAYRSFGEDAKVTLAARTQIGSLVGTSIANAPANYLFYSGGGGSVRGQQYNALGVDSVINGQSVRTGGQSFAGAQLEARYGVTDDIGLVGFYDVGRISADAGFGGDSEWHAGAGIGVRYNTGIGPIRLDIGTPASGDNIGQSVQVYIGIGQAF